MNKTQKLELKKRINSHLVEADRLWEKGFSKAMIVGYLEASLKEVVEELEK